VAVDQRRGREQPPGPGQGGIVLGAQGGGLTRAGEHHEQRESESTALTAHEGGWMCTSSGRSTNSGQMVRSNS
jgi:hypothetical protein